MRFLLALLLLSGLALDSSAAAAQASGIAVFYGERSAVILRVPARGPDGSLSEVQPDLIQACRGALLAAPSAEVARASSPRSDVDFNGLLDVTVIANAPREAACNGNWIQSPIPDVRVDRTSGDGVTWTGTAIRDVRVSVGTDKLEPQRVARLPLLWLPPAGLNPTALVFQHLSLRMGDVAPNRAGLARDLIFTVSLEGGGPDDVIVLSWESLRDLWQAALVARVAMMTSAVPLVSLPAPRDQGLRDASAEIARGGVAVDAMLHATRRAHAFELLIPDRTWARAQSALALDQLGDTLGVRLTMAELLADEPCFRWRAEASERLHNLTAGLAASDARCTAAPLWKVAGRAIVAPGFARPALRDGRRRPRAAITAVVLGALAVGQWQNGVALDQFDEYESTQLVQPVPGTFPPAPQPNVSSLYRSAENTRVKAFAATVFGVGIWAAHGALELLAERRFSDRLSQISETGIGRSVADTGWRPSLGVVRGGVSLSVRRAW